MRGLISSWTSDLALIFRRGNVADLSVIDAVEVLTAPPGEASAPGEAVHNLKGKGNSYSI